LKLNGAQVLQEMHRLRKFYEGLTPDELAYIAMLKILNEHGTSRLVNSD